MLIAMLSNLGILVSAALALIFLSARSETGFRSLLSRSVGGLVLGCIAAALILNPVTILPGATFDMRAGPAVLTGVFLGPTAAFTMALMAAGARLWVGGSGAIGGAVSVLVYASFGFLVGLSLSRNGRSLPELYELPLIGVGSAAVVLPTFFVGQSIDVAVAILAQAWWLLLLGNLVGVCILGFALIEAVTILEERNRLRIITKDLELKGRALDQIGMGVIITDSSAERRILYVNSAFERLSGYLAAEILGKNCKFLQGEGTDPSDIASIRDALDNDRPFRGTILNFRKTGERFWNRLQISPFGVETRNGEVHTTHYIGIQEDITPLVEAEQKAEHANRQLESILASAPDVILSVDHRQRIIASNPAIKPLLGWAPEEIVGQPIQLLIASDHHDDHGRFAEGYLADDSSKPGRMTGLKVVNAVRRDGSVTPVMVTLARFMLDGKPAATAVVRDVRAEVDATRELNEKTALLAEQLLELRTANEARRRFLAHMSHELRTPLNAIIGFSDLMAAEAFGPLGGDRYRGYAQDINQSGAHLLAIVNDMLDMARLEADAFKLEMSEECSELAIENSCRLVHGLADKKRQEIKTDLHDSVLQYLGDQRAVQQILINMLSNAIKFSPEGSMIRIQSGEEDAGRIFISVSDTGPGIPDEILNNIGKPFLQKPDDLYSMTHGTGLGLAISSALAEKMNGRLLVTSALGRGTTVKLILPGGRRI